MSKVSTEQQLQLIQQAQQRAADLKADYRPLDPDHVERLFTEARSQNGWLDKPVSDDLLRELYDLTKMGSTSMNCCPARFVFLRTQAGKERLKPALAEANVTKAMEAPVLVIIGYDIAFYEHMNKLFPHKDVRPLFEADPKMAAATAFRNGTLQGAYLMMAARALGLDCGPMSGFNNHAVDELFFTGTQVKSNFLFGLGHGDHRKLFQRLPRFDCDEVCQFC